MIFKSNLNVSVIDVGSNSVRYMLVAGGKILFKKSIVSQMCLGKKDGFLAKESMVRTLNAILLFVTEAKKQRFPIYVFATAGVRNSLNGNEFVQEVNALTGVEMQVLSGEEEAEVALLGALKGKDGAVIDIGGGSSEVIVKSKGEKYFYSLDVGAVALYNDSGNNLEIADKLLKEKIKEYGVIPSAEFMAVGGTATSLAGVMLKLKKYEDNLVDGFVIEKKELEKTEKEIDVSPEVLSKNYCVDVRRAVVLKFGTLILKRIMEKARISRVTVSTSDNLEGFLLWKEEKAF